VPLERAVCRHRRRYDAAPNLAAGTVDPEPQQAPQPPEPGFQKHDLLAVRLKCHQIVVHLCSYVRFFAGHFVYRPLFSYISPDHPSFLTSLWGAISPSRFCPPGPAPVSLPRAEAFSFVFINIVESAWYLTPDTRPPNPPAKRTY
jgi:hypothetical protein